jgi:hypothetical protein
LRGQLWFGLGAAALLLVLTSAWEARDIINAMA